MKWILGGAGVAGVALMLGSCATMSEDQCRAGDWGGVGFADGAAGYTADRIQEHAKACAKHQIAPDFAVYSAAREDGLRRYCTPESGFSAGRRGASYARVCPAELEGDFLPAYEDGRVTHAAESALESARSSVDGYARRLEELDDKLRAKQEELRQEGLTDEQREQIRNRIQEVRQERRDRERDWRRAQDELREAERRWDEVRWRFGSRYRI